MLCGRDASQQKDVEELFREFLFAHRESLALAIISIHPVAAARRQSHKSTVHRMLNYREFGWHLSTMMITVHRVLKKSNHHGYCFCDMPERRFFDLRVFHRQIGRT